MEFRVLGPLEVRADDGPLPLGGAKQRALLALLLLNANRVVARERLIDELWGERSAGDGGARRCRCTSRGCASCCRRGRCVTRPPGYLLEVEPEAVDLLRFERLVAEARRADPERASQPAARGARAVARPAAGRVRRGAVRAGRGGAARGSAAGGAGGADRGRPGARPPRRARRRAGGADRASTRTASGCAGS